MGIRQTLGRALLLLGSCALAGCSHSSNVAGNYPCQGADAYSRNSPPPPPPPPPPSPPRPLFYDTGLTGSLGVPAPASFGDSPVPAQIAPLDGSNFETANKSAFPVLSASLQAASTGLAVSPHQGATAVVTSTGKDTYDDPCVIPHDVSGTGANIQLSIPALNLNLSWSVGDIHNTDISGFTDSLTYILLGNWEQRQSSNGANALQSETWYVFGYETPATLMPTTGQASFTGASHGTVFTPTAGTIGGASVNGSAAFSADFASGKITGAFTKLEVYPNRGTETLWNDVSINAAIAVSGATAITSTPQGLFTLSGSADGSINGAFYGPATQNLGAIWTLSDGTKPAIGGVVAGH
jgi:hypothetical protein